MSMSVQGELLVPSLARYLADYADIRRVTVSPADPVEIDFFDMAHRVLLWVTGGTTLCQRSSDT